MWTIARQESAKTAHARPCAALAMKATLEHLVHCCHGDERPECPILDVLASNAPPGAGHSKGAHIDPPPKTSHPAGPMNACKIGELPLA